MDQEKEHMMPTDAAQEPGVKLRDFELLGKVYGPPWQDFSEDDPWYSLIRFLSYAHERQGAPAVFAQAAADVVEELKGQGCEIDDADLPDKAWKLYTELLHGRNLNVGNNPMAPRGTLYPSGKRKLTVGKMSAIEMVCNLKPSLISVTRDHMSKNEVKEAHSLIMKVNGVGDKIASFFLRDVALYLDLNPTKDRHLLQPVDIWVRRATQQCSDITWKPNTDQEVKQVIVEAATAHQANPERVNAGMWYFGARVARSEYRLLEAMKNRQLFFARVEEYIVGLRSALDAYGTFSTEFMHHRIYAS